VQRREELNSRMGMLRCIALFKLVKAMLLLVVAATEVRLLHHDVTQPFLHLTRVIHVDPDNRYLHGILAWLLSIDEKELRLLSIGTVLYSALFSVEGIGLWFARTWAEYLTVLSTAGLIPVEIYELIKKMSSLKILVLFFNMVIVLYLLRRLRDSSRLLR
jgi:uncharacterized membrane protein (DUF2068 family)